MFLDLESAAELVLCKESAVIVITHWPTFKFTLFVYQILGNSASLIEVNDSKGSDPLNVATIKCSSILTNTM